MTQFSDFGLSEPLLRALDTAGHTTPTPIQVQAIPRLLEGRDLVGIAQTGTGKTAAFALPALDRLARSPRGLPKGGARVLVLSPTRELASQIADSFRTYGAHLRLTVNTVFGGVKIGKHLSTMRGGSDVLVATPGRLIDLMDRRALRLDDVEVFVLDEADQMMDMGFIHALKKIIPQLPGDRQNLFFSATMPKPIADLAGSFLNDPVKVSVTPAATTAERVEQRVLFVSGDEKLKALGALVRRPDVERALVFTRTKHGADKVVRKLGGYGVQAAAIHGNRSQPQREKALKGFRAGSIPVLVATDIAARGIDVPGVSHVFNFELPNVPEAYVHRIGRTARAGAEGLAISLCDAADERYYLWDIERLTREPIETMDAPEGVETDEPPKPGFRPAKPKGPAGRQRPQNPRAGRPPQRSAQTAKPGGGAPKRRRRRKPQTASA
ncbi:MAG: DEAD/DEAH box helicase [Pseudomonadota bacterium]